MIDLYCERVAAGLAGEPLNALSNALFVLAALLAAREARARGQNDSLFLAALIFLIGIGSALFHTFATRWAEWLDVLPIMAFELCFLGLYLRRLCGLAAPRVAATLAVFLGTVAAAAQAPAWLNGSLGYVPAVLVVMALGFDYARREGRRDIHAAAALFVVSLTTRSIDNALCAVWPWGTHFIWHALNALLLSALMRAYMRSARR